MPTFDPSTALQPHSWQSLFGKSALRRAEEYRDDVSALQIQPHDGGLVVAAKVQGTERKPYVTKVTIVPDGRAFDYLFDCSCPVGWACKHAAAMLMLAAAREDGAGEAVFALRPMAVRQPASRPPAWKGWLQTLESSMRPLPTIGAAAARQLAVVFDATTYTAPGELLAGLIWVQPTKQGRLGKPEPVRLTGPGNDADALDESWHARLARLRMSEARWQNNREMYVLRGARGETLLEELLAAGAPCFWQKPTNGLLQHGPDQPLSWGWHTGDEGMQTLKPDSTALLLRIAGLWQLDPATRVLQRAVDDGTADLAAALLRLPPLPPEQAADFVAQWQTHSRLRVLPAPRVLVQAPSREIAPTPVLRLLQHPLKPDRYTSSSRSAERPQLPCARLEFDYDGHRIPGPAARGSVRRVDGDTLHVLTRRFDIEQAAQAALAEANLTALFDRHDLRYRVDGESQPADHVIGRAYSPVPGSLELLQRITPLAARGFRLEMDASFPIALAAPPDHWYADISEDPAGGAWFDTELGIEIDGERFALRSILQRALADRRLTQQPAVDEPEDALWYAPLDDTRHVALPLRQIRALLAPLLQWLEGGEGDNGRLRLPRVAAGLLDDLTGLQQLRLQTQTADSIRALAAQLRTGGHGHPITVPSDLQAQLRPYQHDGLAWLDFLAQARLGGVLADDMGLGKTVQVLAHLLVEREAGRLTSPALVVCPTSVVGNWREQAARFAPSLRVRVLHGADRHGHFDALDDCDLAITTYALLPRDREALLQQPFALAIFDEAQALKNARSQAAQVARALPAARKLAVTGTPLENHLGELWAQFDCVLPGLLGNAQSFTRHFRSPIEKHGDGERQARLNRRIAPFVLRRTKEQVARELPPKTEIVHTLELAGKQRALYETLRLAMHEKVQQAIAKRGVGQSSIVVLDALLKLRQACCDPRLVRLDAARKVPDSAKLDALLPMLEELLAEGRRILLFSQFTQMLDLLEAALRERGIDWLRLDGSTRDRATPIARFQAGEVPLFLISLKAGGVGLNLTAADTVIHYDPWWNPAVERQATDRAHRIGQTKPVFVYKLICAGTVEEKIQALQRRKGDLARAVLEGGSRTGLKFDEADIAELFAPV